jgi:hypothetical protein
VIGAASGVYELHVIAATFPDGDGVNCSIVARGQFDHVDFTENPAYLEPLATAHCLPGCAACDGGRCICENSSVGDNCQRLVSNIKTGIPITTNVKYGEVSYAALREGIDHPPGEIVRVTVNRVGGNTRPRLVMCTSAIGGTVIANPGWECGPADLGANQVEADNQGEFHLALFIRCAEAVTVRVVIERTDMSGTVWRWKEKSWIKMALFACSVVCFSIYIGYTCARLRRIRIPRVGEETKGRQV